MSRMSEAKSYQSRGRLSQAPEPSNTICRDSTFLFLWMMTFRIVFRKLVSKWITGEGHTKNWLFCIIAFLKLWTHHFRGAQNLDLLWGVILIEICAWRLSFWNPDTDRNLPWQHFIATSTDTIVVLMPCHHSSFSNWKAKKMPKMFLRRVIFFSKKCLALKVVWTLRTMASNWHSLVTERRSAGFKMFGSWCYISIL